MVACAETLTAEGKVKGPFAHTDLRAGGNNIPNGTADACWFGWQTMEEHTPYGGSGSTDTPTKQYVWGTYIDECLQLNLLAVAGPQQLAIGVYYLLQDTLYRTMALANSSGAVVEAYDTDAYGNTIIFTGPGPDNTWFTDDDTQSSYGANSIIYCGYRYDAKTGNYYVRNRYYSPTLGRWLTRDPIGYRGGINLYGYVNSSPVGNVDAEGEAGFTLAYRTRSVPRPRHEGAFDGWYIRWLIRPQNKIIFPASLHEFVIQHMEITVSVFDAETGLPIHSKDGHIGYWEAWHARPGNMVPGPEIDSANDEWYWRNKEGRHTKGRITYTGTAAFYTGVTLQGWIKHNPRTLAHALPSTNQNPHFQADSNIITRKLVVTWNWCKDRGLDKISYTK
jgi:RHS repeat-associated protein